MSQYKGLTAVQAAEQIRARHRKWGKMGASNEGVGELEGIVVVLLEIIEQYKDGLTKEEATKLRRQLAAANARVARQAGREED